MPSAAESLNQIQELRRQELHVEQKMATRNTQDKANRETTTG